MEGLQNRNTEDVLISSQKLHSMKWQPGSCCICALAGGFFLGPKALAGLSYRAHHSRVYARPYDGQLRGSLGQCKKVD